MVRWSVGTAGSIRDRAQSKCGKERNETSCGLLNTSSYTCMYVYKYVCMYVYIMYMKSTDHRLSQM